MEWDSSEAVAKLLVCSVGGMEDVGLETVSFYCQS